MDGHRTLDSNAEEAARGSPCGLQILIRKAVASKSLYQSQETSLRVLYGVPLTTGPASEQPETVP